MKRLFSIFLLLWLSAQETQGCILFGRKQIDNTACLNRMFGSSPFQACQPTPIGNFQNFCNNALQIESCTPIIDCVQQLTTEEKPDIIYRNFRDDYNGPPRITVTPTSATTPTPESFPPISPNFPPYSPLPLFPPYVPGYPPPYTPPGMPPNGPPTKPPVLPPGPPVTPPGPPTVPPVPEPATIGMMILGILLSLRCFRRAS